MLVFSVIITGTSLTSHSGWRHMAFFLTNKPLRLRPDYMQIAHNIKEHLYVGCEVSLSGGQELLAPLPGSWRSNGARAWRRILVRFGSVEGDRVVSGAGLTPAA